VHGDEAAMAEAVALGERGRLTAAPNPWVGCVVVAADGQVVGRGFHLRAGEPHAEIHALREAGDRARGATVYVTLEPCAHQGRTPPCAPALVEAGVSRVVIAVLDPDDRVAGRGVDLLRAAGIAVEVGVGAESAARSFAPYLHHRRTGRPLCVLKTAVSLDGRTAAADGTSQWITGPEARADAHRLRAESGAVVVGAGTALADHPSLTFRDVDFEDGPVPPQPLRVLVDASGRVPATGPLFDPSLAPTLVITTTAASAEARAAWTAAGAEVEDVVAAPAAPPFPGAPSRPDGPAVDLAATLGILGRRGVLQAMVEGGATLHGALLRAGLADRLVVYTGGVVLGSEARPLFAGPGPASLAEASRWRLTAVRSLGVDARLDWEPAEPGDSGGSPASPEAHSGGSPASPEAHSGGSPASPEAHLGGSPASPEGD
jgi:diaminohydroxyphosphoribosylaminopyrimidine deaminase/5-amino-6-(5-phosphoribosylamino)uracil reductase